MACCGQTEKGFIRVWHLRVPGEVAPREYADQATAVREQRKIPGAVALSVLKRITEPAPK